MRKSDLIEKLVQRFPTLSRQEVERAVSTLLGEIAQCLAAGGRFEVRDFGVLSTHLRDGKMARNPRTGQQVYVATRRVVHFKPGKRFRIWGRELGGETEASGEGADGDAITSSRASAGSTMAAVNRVQA